MHITYLFSLPLLSYHSICQSLPVVSLSHLAIKKHSLLKHVKSKTTFSEPIITASIAVQSKTAQTCIMYGGLQYTNIIT